MTATEGPPRSLAAEVARSRLLAELPRRFTSAVTTVIAGPGFGKSTLLAQALRQNEAAPHGIDAWVSGAPGFEDAERLAGAIMQALGHTPTGVQSPLDHVLQAIVERSPLDVCIVLDDCHVVTPGSSGETLLADLVRHLPSNGHLAFSGRWIPDVPLARLRAQNRVLSFTEIDLAFSDDEVAVAAQRWGRDVASISDLGGWPALIRLALAVGPGVDREFLREEVLAALPIDQRRALLALVVMGPSRHDELAVVLGHDVDLDRLVQSVPLVTVDDKGRHRAHQLWEDTLVATTDPQELSEVRSRAFDCLMSMGDLPRAATVAVADRNWHDLGRASIELVRSNMTHMPIDTARAWRDAVPVENWSSWIALLDITVRHADDARDPLVDRLIDETIRSCRADGDLLGESTAIGLGALVAHGRADTERLMHLAFQAAEMTPGHGDAVVEMIVHALRATMADLRGEPEAVLEELAEVRWDDIPLELRITPYRLWVQAMWMCGRAEETYALADERLAFIEQDHVRRTPALSRWFAGDPSGFDTEGLWVDVEPSFNERDRFVGACFITVIMSSAGSTDRIEELWSDGSLAALAFDNARDSAHLTTSGVARAVLEHDEQRAVRLYADHLARYPVTDTLGERHLRRWPALGVVLSPELRSHWAAASLGPSHRRAVDCGEALLAARAGRVAHTELGAPQLYTQLPLPWSIELAARWWSLGGHDAGIAVLGFLSDRLGDICATELRSLADREPGLAVAVAALGEHLPSAPADAVEVSVLGDLLVRRGGTVVDAPELRRSRVRQLLAVLVVERTVRRDRAIDLLWPEMTPDSAAGNLRVTLAHLRRLLEPERGSGDATFHLRTDGSTITLHRSTHLHVDLWEFDDLAARLAQGTAGIVEQTSVLARMAELWRGEPLVDLRAVGTYDLLIDRLVMRQVGTLVRLGELHIAEGDSDAALRCAESLLALDPFREQAHRLAVAAHLQRGDTTGARRALDRLDEMLADLGVRPETATEILRRQVLSRSG